MNFQPTCGTADARMLLAIMTPEGGGGRNMSEGYAATVSKWKLRLILAVLLVAGCVLIFASHYMWDWLGPVVKELGSGLIVAAAIGGTVELFLKNEFSRDAFVAAFRYVLPSEFKDEADKILRNTFIARRHVWTVEVKKISADIVEVESTFQRELVNKTSTTQNKSSLYTAPDLDFPNGQTRILECGIQVGDKKIEEFKTDKKDNEIKAATAELSIKPGAMAFVWGRAIQYRRSTDQLYETFMTPATNPEIKVIVPDEFEHVVEFGTAGDVERDKFKNNYRLNGVYFPGQYMLVRWWPKKDQP